MEKKKAPLKYLGKETTRLHLKRLYPFLKTEYRAIEKKELESKSVFTELFGDIPFDENRLKVLFLYQK